MLLLLLALACGDPEKLTDDAVDSAPADDSADDSAEDTGPVDADADGFIAAEDCDDADPSVHPGAAERCDGVDQDCDGVADQGLRGASAECPAESCAQVLALTPDADDGDYHLDPEGDGDPALYACDMRTDGGGWTRVLAWDRLGDGATVAELEALMVTNFNNFTDWSEEDGFLRWSDYDTSADVLDLERTIEVPNGGELLLDANIEAVSHDDAGVFFAGQTSAGWEELWCRAYWGTSSDFLNAWTATEQEHHPYDCSQRVDGEEGDWHLQEPVHTGLSGPVTSFRLVAFQYDGGFRDITRMYALKLWVR